MNMLNIPLHIIQNRGHLDIWGNPIDVFGKLLLNAI